MAPPLDGDLGVDVLVIGAGIQGLYIARELQRSYRVCVVSDPAVPCSTLEAGGYFSAGYDGNDVNRIQPARRAAAWWRLWAESEELPFEREPPWYVVEPADVAVRTRLWSDATLATTAAPDLPPVFGGGTLEGASAYRTDTDLVLNPGTLLSHLGAGLESSCIVGEVVRFGLVGDDAVDHVQVQVGEQVVPIVPRFVVLAAGIGNATLLNQLSARFSGQAKRKASKELVEGCQAVTAQHHLCVRGPDLPAVSGRFGSLTIAAQPLTDGESAWVIAPSLDDATASLGPVNMRFAPTVDPGVIASTVDELFAMSPLIEKQAGDLRWSAYVSRRAQHPMTAARDRSTIARPVPAKLEKFGLEAFLAVWPSHLAYAQFVGDAVAERIAEALGPRGDFSDSADPSDLDQAPPPLRARWDEPGFPWQDWNAFVAAWKLDRG
jgi:glycine/D-amino acid oxidase-like deaminating enzyme